MHQTKIKVFVDYLLPSQADVVDDGLLAWIGHRFWKSD
jgi:hypothetical protein